MKDQLSSADVQRLLGRAEFLKLAGAAGLGVAAGSAVLSRGAEAAVRTNLDPTDFSFRVREQFRPFHLVAENFVTLDDSFGRNSVGDYTTVRPGPADEDDGTVEAQDGTMRFDGPDDYYTILVSDTGQEAPFASVIVDVASLPAEGGIIYSGLYREDGEEFVHAYYDNENKTVGFEVRVNGQTYTMDNPNEALSMGPAAQPEQRLFEAPFRFAFVANENRAIALVSSASDLGGWRPIIERDVFFETNGQMDMRDQSRLEPAATALKNGFGARSEAGDEIAFDRVRGGYFGEAGVRDPHAVQYADGTPYIKNNKLYFTLTNAGLGFFEKAHWGVWTLDLDDYTNIEQVGNIFWRNVDDPVVPATKVLGHHAGQIVRDEEGERWIIPASSWGDFGPQGGDGRLTPGTVTPNPTNPPVDVIFAELPLTEDILRGVHVLPGQKHPVNAQPFPTEGKWDPSLTRIDGQWHLAYVIATDLFTDFQPALAIAPAGADHTAAVFVGADWGKRATEGVIFQKLGGQWRLLASCGDDEPPQFDGRYPIYFLEAANPTAPPEERTLAFDGWLDAPHPTNIPHPQIVPISYRGGGRTRTKYIMITFNGDQYYIERLGYGTHGDFYVMEAEQRVRGREFPRRG